jgi:DNA-binding GntR family transcriptional regulator
VSQGRGKPVVVADDARANAALWAARAQRSEALAIALARYAQSEPTSSRPDGRSGTQAVRAFLLWAISNGELQAGDRVRVPQLSKAFDIDSSTAFVALTEFTGDPPLLAHQGAGKPIVVADGASANVTAWASRQQRAEALATALTRYATAGNSQARPESSGGVPAMRMFLIWAIDSGELQAGDPVYLRALSVAFGVDYSTARVALTEFTGDAPVLVGRRNGVPTVVAETARENLADWQAAYEQRKAPARLAALKAYQQTPDYTQPPISSNRSAAVRSFVLWAVESGNLKPGDAVAIGPLASAFGLDRTSTYRALTKFPPGTQVLKSSADGAGMVVATGH